VSVSFNLRAWSILHDGSMTLQSRHLSERISRPADEVYAYASPRNDFGILDHYVTLDSAEVIYIPMRVITDESGSEVLFTLRRRPGITEAEFGADADAVAADLARLKCVMEG